MRDRQEMQLGDLNQMTVFMTKTDVAKMTDQRDNKKRLKCCRVSTPSVSYLQLTPHTQIKTITVFIG
ncbi:hypothetical protein G7B40_013065 [Aetokthonos hydrillicola Thurmond2011]|uniref:Uncharacterized protein n=1 Tax=Aetokthonos hydrillicola Thurmond2011 TaxID=2712845 RepID=A0AAP5M7V5_9CYAN|nr:hypothetical protein [Aetokthonos hydrillicola]MBO3459452.1 hypothetical protein [Aetokthonos hydrillicola CCALA 1050]MBW4583815.1 hypothetical protein [Aetokthonos hydrillicola CCALA 1050]MDR9895490.1 hypothetical protein [Aetokthonos hydrillicola Thurmond2011]